MSTCDHPGVDRVLSSLAAHRRRFILDYLMDTEAGQASFDELVDHVVENETRSPAPDREAVATTLHQTHLPKLADERLVEVYRENGSIKITDRTRLTEPYLGVARNWPAESGAAEQARRG